MTQGIVQVSIATQRSGVMEIQASVRKIFGQMKQRVIDEMFFGTEELENKRRVEFAFDMRGDDDEFTPREPVDSEKLWEMFSELKKIQAVLRIYYVLNGVPYER
jgi:hypothetical protein